MVSCFIWLPFLLALIACQCFFIRPAMRMQLEEDLERLHIPTAAESPTIHPTLQQAATYVRARPRLMLFLQFWDVIALHATTGVFYFTGMLLFIMGMYVNYSFAQDFVFTLAAYKPPAF
jgi:hypothetical protein